MFAEHLGPMTDEQKALLKALADTAVWRTIPGKRYETSQDMTFWEPCNRAFFIRLRPKQSVHPHGDKVPGLTEHWVLETNPHCLNWWKEDGKDHSIHLEAGHRYAVEREPIHWATNDGDTDRIHLLVEYG